MILQIENNLSMLAKDTSLRDSLRERLKVCLYPLIVFSICIETQGITAILDLTMICDFSAQARQAPAIQQDYDNEGNSFEPSSPGGEEQEKDEDDEEELALWSSEVQVLELEKGERGLGFSILDYQVMFFVHFLTPVNVIFKLKADPQKRLYVKHLYSIECKNLQQALIIMLEKWQHNAALQTQSQGLMCLRGPLSHIYFQKSQTYCAIHKYNPLKRPN